MGFALIFYGLNLMTGGLRPLRSMPEVMGVISSLKADSYVGLLYCVLIAAGIWAIYRIVKGMLNFYDSKPMYQDA